MALRLPDCLRRTCPYIAQCGPETSWSISNDAEAKEEERICYTFCHRSCPTYQAKKEQDRIQREGGPEAFYD